MGLELCYKKANPEQKLSRDIWIKRFFNTERPNKFLTYRIFAVCKLLEHPSKKIPREKWLRGLCNEEAWAAIRFFEEWKEGLKISDFVSVAKLKEEDSRESCEREDFIKMLEVEITNICDNSATITEELSKYLNTKPEKPWLVERILKESSALSERLKAMLDECSSR